MTITPGAFVEIPFSFLPFSIEFRLLPQPSTILMLSNARNESLLQINVNQKGYLSLTANISRVEQVSHPGLLAFFENVAYSFSEETYFVVQEYFKSMLKNHLTVAMNCDLFNKFRMARNTTAFVSHPSIVFSTFEWLALSFVTHTHSRGLDHFYIDCY